MEMPTGLDEMDVGLINFFCCMYVCTYVCVTVCITVFLREFPFFFSVFVSKINKPARVRGFINNHKMHSPDIRACDCFDIFYNIWMFAIFP